RMKCELVAALLHKPKILFLDEPTLGVDVTMQTRIREVIRAYNRRYQAQVLLTSHYMADIAALCQRVIIIHHGRVMFDGELSRLVGMVAPFKVLRVAWEGPIAEERLQEIGEVLSFDGGKASLRVPKEKTREVTSRLLAELPVLDLSKIGRASCRERVEISVGDV